MSRVLVLYGTTDGQAAKVAGVVAAAFESRGLNTELCDAARSDPDPSLYCAVVVVASVHAGGYQRAVKRWLKKVQIQLAVKPTAFVSVCLGVLQHEPAVDAELAGILRRFFTDTGWQPDETKIVAGALPYSKYGLLRRYVMQRIVAKAGGDTDTSRDYEYTDWEDLRAFAAGFAAQHLSSAQPPPAARIPRTPPPGAFAHDGPPGAAAAGTPAP